jgi:hypothetical protein
MAGYYGGILFLVFLSVLLLVILGYFAHEQGDYRYSPFNWFIIGEPRAKKSRNRYQPPPPRRYQPPSPRNRNN